ncbi:MAG: aminomethyl-transferring glycine dehydrogenase subunit GcvPA [Thaumarchaeota archaeon]|nr:aminomethyl-transferring glycine dehydrogenase subunit GcvPA [Nitrososphaerota archaeon]
MKPIRVKHLQKAHPFLPNSDEQTTKKMLQKIGVPSIETLFEDIPKDIRLTRELNLPDALSEAEIERHVESLLKKNMVPPEYLCFLGGGAWLHHVPAAVDEIISRSEFYTSYTPYQPEISQGMLQALFEYQSLICDLTGMQVANSSMYDWATAAGEAARMAMRITKRRKIVSAKSIGPDRLGTIQTYCYPIEADVKTISFDEERGNIELSKLTQNIDNETAAIYVENPNFFGVIETQLRTVAEEAHRHGALIIVGVDPISLGSLKPPGDYGADIVVGEGQPLGLSPNFGGPLLGIFAAKDDPAFLRQMPGRIIGATNSKEDNRRGYTMILQTREQHIRRESATSNICTNEALLAVAAAAYLSLAGPEGLRDVGEACISNSHLAANRLSKIDGVKSPRFTGPFFKDFTVSIEDGKTKAEQLPQKLLEHGILGGLPLGSFFEDLKDCLLFSVTEMHTDEDIEKLCNSIRKVLEMK